MLPIYIASFFIASTILRSSNIAKENNEYRIVNTSNEVMVEVLEPGLVIIRNYLSEGEQQRMAKCALKHGSDDDKGFFEVDANSGEIVPNVDKTRGRIYDALTRFPVWVKDNGNSACDLARRVDPTMPTMDCTHLLLNMYTSSEGLVWHRDVYENDVYENNRKSEVPVINMCVGASCRVGLRHFDEAGMEGDVEREIILRSGDVLIFGGKCRYIKHAVLEVMLDDCPEWMKIPCRFSFTYRDSPEVIGHEEEFRQFNIDRYLIGEEKFKLSNSNKKVKNRRKAFVHVS